MNEILFKDLKVEFVYKKNLKHSYVSVKPSSVGATITLKSPIRSNSFAQSLLLEKEAWIRKQLLTLQKRKPMEMILEDEALLFGETYSIDCEEIATLRESLLKVKTQNSKEVMKSYDAFYKERSKVYLTKRVDYFSDLMSLKYNELKFRKMKSRWGSCSSKKTITLNTELMKIEKDLIDYVVVHELAHLTHMNHSKEFHSLVGNYVNDSKLIRKKLKNVYFLK